MRISVFISAQRPVCVSLPVEVLEKLKGTRVMRVLLSYLVIPVIACPWQNRKDGTVVRETGTMLSLTFETL